MLSSVLNSERAIEVNIAIMRAFVQLRKMIASHDKLTQKLAELEQHLESHDEQIQAIFEAIRQLMTPPEKPRKKIGFMVKEKRATYGSLGTKHKRLNGAKLFLWTTLQNNVHGKAGGIQYARNKLAGRALILAGNRIMATLPAIIAIAFKTNKRYYHYNKQLTKI